MAEIKNQEEPALQASKRNKPDASSEVEPLDYPNKTLKLDSSDNQTPSSETLDGKAPTKDAEIEAGPGEDENGEDDDDKDYGSGDEEDEEEEEDGEKSNNGEADRKGKGIMTDDKGKGKLIVEEDEDDDDDDDDSEDDDCSDGGGSELDSDLSDDPLTEVDLDNILPSRTRRRQAHPPTPGVYIANDLGNDGDDSDDSDA